MRLKDSNFKRTKQNWQFSSLYLIETEQLQYFICFFLGALIDIYKGLRLTYSVVIIPVILLWNYVTYCVIKNAYEFWRFLWRYTSQKFTLSSLGQATLLELHEYDFFVDFFFLNLWLLKLNCYIIFLPFRNFDCGLVVPHLNFRFNKVITEKYCCVSVIEREGNYFKFRLACISVPVLCPKKFLVIFLSIILILKVIFTFGVGFPKFTTRLRCKWKYLLASFH